MRGPGFVNFTKSLELAPKKHLEPCSLALRLAICFVPSRQSCVRATAFKTRLVVNLRASHPFRGDCMPPPSDLKRTAWRPSHSQTRGGRPSRAQYGQHAIAPVRRSRASHLLYALRRQHGFDHRAHQPTCLVCHGQNLQTHSRLHAVARWWRSWTASGRTDLPELNRTSPLAV